MSWAKAAKQAAKQTCETFQRPDFKRAVIDWAHLVVLDFETYWDDEYTLKKLSTSEYIRDPRFKAHMVGVKIGKQKTKVVPHEKLATFLRTIDWSQHDLLAHNTAFDGFILSDRYGVVPRRYYDTLSMARGLHSNDIGAGLDEVAQYYGVGNKIPNVLERTKGILKLDKPLYTATAEYCGEDVNLCLSVFERMLVDYPATEIELIDLTIRMFCDPVLLVDIPRVQKEYDREVAERKELILGAVDLSKYTEKELLKGKGKELPEDEKQMLMAKRVIGSNERFADLLRELHVEPPVKISPAWIKKPKEERKDEDKWAYAFAKDDEAFNTLPEKIEEWTPDLNPNSKKDVPKIIARQERIQQLVDARIATKSTTNITRAARFLKAGENGKPLPVGYAYYRAHTGRHGGNNKMNMQNLKRGGELRQAILAPKGMVIVVGDSGQIECRVNGWLWGQDDLINAFRDADNGIGKDAYCNFASVIYGREITKDDKEERFVGKVCVLGLGYSMGAPKLQMTFAKGALGGPKIYFELDRCKEIVNTYRNKNYKIVNGWKICTQIIEDMAAGRTGSYKCISWEKERIWLPNGMCLKYPDLRCEKNSDTGWDEWSYQSKEIRKKIYGGLLCENIVQALARIIVMEQMLEINKKRRAVMTTHDEVASLARVRGADKAFAETVKIMRTPLPWCMDLPLNSEGGYAYNYSK